MSQMPRPPAPADAWPPWPSRLTSMSPLTARTLWECVPAGTSRWASWRGVLGSRTSTSVVPCGAFMWATYATRPSTTTCPPPGQSNHATCRTPWTLLMLGLREPDDVERGHRLDEPFQHELADGLRLDQRVERAHQPPRDQDLTRLGLAAQPRGKVRDGTDGAVVQPSLEA